MKKIGITGGIATGKSTVTQYLRSKGYPVIDVDQGAREVVKPGQIGYSNIKMLFGEKVIQESGELDRKALAQIIFENPDKRMMVDAILHPLIFNWVAAQLIKLQDHALVFVDMPLLFETGYHKKVDESWLVYAPEEMQIQRLMKRNNLSQEEAIDRVKAQWSINDKRDYATAIINNISTLDDLYRQVDNLLLFI